MLIRLADVSLRYGERYALRRVSLGVEPGATLLLAGNNGAGKSTLLRILAGLLRPEEGQVQRACPPEAVAYLDHATFLYPGFTALENLDFWQQSLGVRRDRDALEALLQRVGLAAHADDPVSGFSRGMAQRLNLARVLAQRPRLLLLDEPATGLDVHARAMLRQEILAARNAGTGVVWVSHDLTGDLPLADRVLLLDKQRVAFDGSVAAYAAFAASAESVSADGMTGAPPNAVTTARDTVRKQQKATDAARVMGPEAKPTSDAGTPDAAGTASATGEPSAPNAPNATYTVDTPDTAEQTVTKKTVASAPVTASTVASAPVPASTPAADTAPTSRTSPDEDVSC